MHPENKYAPKQTDPISEAVCANLELLAGCLHYRTELSLQEWR